MAEGLLRHLAGEQFEVFSAGTRPVGLNPNAVKAMYRRRNEIERLFRRLKGFRRIFSRFDKLDLVFLAFLHFALIVEALRYLISVNTP